MLKEVKMIVKLTGGVGSFKTCLLTRYGKISYTNGRKIFSNYHLNRIPYTKLDLVDLYFNHPELNNAVILGDEFYSFMDCRMSGAKRNRLESYFVAQTRKKNFDLYYTTQYSRFMDLRIELFVDIHIEMHNLWIEKDGQQVKHPYLAMCTMTDYRNPDNWIRKEFVFDGRNYFMEYDTNEAIYPPDDYIKVFEKISKHKNTVG